MTRVSFCFIVGTLLVLWMPFLAIADVQEDYKIDWSQLKTDDYYKYTGEAPVYLGDGAEYFFSVENAPDGAKFEWTIVPQGGIETILGIGDLLKWQAPMSGDKYTIKVEAWIPGPGPGPGETLKGMWDDTLEIPFLDIYFKDAKGKETYDEAFLPVTKEGENPATRELYAFVGTAKKGSSLDGIGIYWEDRNTSGQPGDWTPKEPDKPQEGDSRTSSSGEASTTFTVDSNAEVGDYQEIGAEIKTAPDAGKAKVTETSGALKINIFDLTMTAPEWVLVYDTGSTPTWSAVALGNPGGGSFEWFSKTHQGGSGQIEFVGGNKGKTVDIDGKTGNAVEIRGTSPSDWLKKDDVQLGVTYTIDGVSYAEAVADLTVRRILGTVYDENDYCDPTGKGANADTKKHRFYKYVYHPVTDQYDEVISFVGIPVSENVGFLEGSHERTHGWGKVTGDGETKDNGVYGISVRDYLYAPTITKEYAKHIQEIGAGGWGTLPDYYVYFDYQDRYGYGLKKIWKE